jgi:hypothetical protein
VDEFQEESYDNNLVISMPQNCNEEECSYICDKFIGFNGINEEAADLEVL